MPHIEHRQPAVRRRSDPKGLDGVVACLSRWGWLAIAAGLVWMIVGFIPLTNPGALETMDPRSLALLVLGRVSDAALIWLVPAFELGFPGVRRRNRSLWRGAWIIAIAFLARPAISAFESWFIPIVDPDLSKYQDPSTAIGLAVVLVRLAVGILTIAGAWTLSDGLADAGARPKRILLALAALGGAGLTLGAYAPFLAQTLDLTSIGGWLNLVGLVMTLVLVAIWMVVAARLVLTTSERLRPQRAWFLAWVTGVILLIQRLGSPISLITDPQSQNLMLATLVSGAASVSWLTLFAAALLGFGRGTERRRIRPAPMRTFEIRRPGDGVEADADREADADADADAPVDAAFAWAHEPDADVEPEAGPDVAVEPDADPGVSSSPNG